MTLSYADQRDLDRYYQLGHFEKSTAGPMLERAWLFSDADLPKVNEDDITAWPTAESRIPAKGEPSTGDLELIGRVSRKLAMLRPLHRMALEAYHGDKGACCAERMKKHGRIVSLFELTPAGRAMARRERLAQGKTRLRLTGAELIQNAVARHEKAPGEAEGTVYQSLTQALELKSKAEEAYTQATYALQEARERKPLPAPVRIHGDDDE